MRLHNRTRQAVSENAALVVQFLARICCLESSFECGDLAHCYHLKVAAQDAVRC